jgi:hypothetical protein
MKRLPASTHVVRAFHRSEAFTEDIADLVEYSTVIAAKRQRSTARTRMWLLGLLPIGAAATTGVTVALLQRLL